MKRRYIASIILVLISKVTCQDDYGDSSGDPNSVAYVDTIYDAGPMEWPLNLQGSLRQRMALCYYETCPMSTKFHEKLDECHLYLEDPDIHRTFMADMFQNGAIADPGKSFVCSPISALLPLGKLALGASGTCKSQLMEAIGVNSMSGMKGNFTSLISGLKKLTSVKLTLCSRIYVNKELSLQPVFEKDAKDVFKSSIKKINVNQPTLVARKINTWVTRKTKGMIEEIVQPNDISTGSSLILVNAVYFSGAWKNRFTKVEIRNFNTATDTRKVPMMTTDGFFKYSKDDTLDCQTVEIPYSGGQASFVIFLPNTKDGLPLLLYKLKLAPEMMQLAMQRMKMESVILSIPKFKTTTDLDLKVAYEKLGLKDILKTQGSGLNGIVQGTQNLYVSKAIQKAVIDVNENGTTAAAASASQLELHSDLACKVHNKRDMHMPTYH